MRPIALLLFCGLAHAADVDFNGRWDLQLNQDNPDKAWWIEVTGVGTPDLKAKFIGFPGGNLNDISNPRIEDHQLLFSFENATVKREYVVKYGANGLLQGQMTGSGGPISFTGYRAPNIRDHDDSNWLKGPAVTLFNGKDLTGWTGLGNAKNLGWTVEDGVLKSTGHAQNLISTTKYWNFILHLEYNVAENSNSGIGLRGRYEVQIIDDYGKPPGTHGSGALYSRILPSVNAAKKAGEWQTVDVRLVGRDVSIALNGKQVIVRGKIDGLTAIAFDPWEGEPGSLELQGDHGAVQFRNISITPLYQPQAQ